MLAWLSITPKESDTTNGQRYGIELPELPFDVGHLPNFLSDIGTAGQGFDRLVPLTFTEIGAWGQAMQISLSSFEFSALHKMSSAYVSIANNPAADCPNGSQVMQANINQVNASSWAAAGTVSNG